MAAGDYFEIKSVFPAWSTNPTNVLIQAWVGYEHDVTGATSLPADANGYLKNNGSGTLSWDSASTMKTFLSLGNVENTALSTWAGTTNITTLGTVSTGTWNGSVLGSTYGGTGINNAGRTLTINTNSGTLAFTTAASTLTVAATGSISGTNTGDQSLAGYVPTSRTINGYDLSANRTLSFTDVGAPANAVGWLENDGAGALSWSTPSGTLPADAEGFLNNDGAGGISWQDVIPELTVTDPMNCGNGTREQGEACDDGDLFDADGCSNACQVESGYLCDQAEPSVCTVADPDIWVPSAATDTADLLAYLGIAGAFALFLVIGFKRGKR